LPLFEKARVEVYLPDLPNPVYQDLVVELGREFTYTFGGCTLIGGIHGNYLSRSGEHIRDRINLIYCDTPYAFTENLQIISNYADTLRVAVSAALKENAILVAVSKTHHSE
jgi:hypothetical protein